MLQILYGGILRRNVNRENLFHKSGVGESNTIINRIAFTQLSVNYNSQKLQNSSKTMNWTRTWSPNNLIKIMYSFPLKHFITMLAFVKECKRHLVMSQSSTKDHRKNWRSLLLTRPGGSTQHASKGYMRKWSQGAGIERVKPQAPAVFRGLVIECFGIPRLWLGWSF